MLNFIKNVTNILPKHYLLYSSRFKFSSEFSKNCCYDEKKEYFDTPEMFDKKITILAKLIQQSKHLIVFTGAGISTSSGIPDYRSGENTIVKTGPGEWERENINYDENKYKEHIIQPQCAIPTPTHMALVELEKQGFIKCLITQNIDGLHSKSGFPQKKIVELHGNHHIEYCKNCDKEYYRDYVCRVKKPEVKHFTGRYCTEKDCVNQKLYDNIVNFGELLKLDQIDKANEESHKADLCISLGSSLQVYPAALIPQNVIENRGDIVLINLQRSMYSAEANMNIFEMCDKAMIKLMEKMKLQLPSFTLQRRLGFKFEKRNNKKFLKVIGFTKENREYSFIKSIKIENDNQDYLQEPFFIDTSNYNQAELLKIQINFRNFHNEKSLNISLDLGKLNENEIQTFDYECDLKSLKWKITNF